MCSEWFCGCQTPLDLAQDHVIEVSGSQLAAAMQRMPCDYGVPPICPRDIHFPHASLCIIDAQAHPGFVSVHYQVFRLDCRVSELRALVASAVVVSVDRVPCVTYQ